MGQRLNIEVYYDGEVLANAYYHWSAYTTSSLCLLEEVLDAYSKSSEISPLKIAVEILQATGTGVNEEERVRISADKEGKFSNIEFRDATNRNDGLLAVTETGIKDTRLWEEGRVTVDISTEKFVFDVMFQSSNEEYDEYREPGDAERLPYTDFDFTVPCPFCDLDKMACVIRNNPDGVRIDEDTVLTWIE